VKVENISYQVNWQKFKPGYSIFVPCVNVRAAKGEVMVVLRRLKIKVVMKVVIEEGIKGLRIWRV